MEIHAINTNNCNEPRFYPEMQIRNVYRNVFKLAGILGIFGTKVNPDGSHSACGRRMLARVICLAVCIAVCMEAYVVQVIYHLPMWFLIMLLPFWYVTVFCIGYYINLFVNFETWKLYAEHTDMLQVKNNFLVTVRILWLFFYSILFVIMVMCLIPSAWYMMMVPCALICIIPAFIDTYMGVFIYSLGYAYKRLIHRIRTIERISLRDIEDISLEWLYLQETLSIHNEVRHSLHQLPVSITGTNSLTF